MAVNHLQVEADRVGQRLDNFLFNYYKKVPKSRVYRAIRGGEVRVNKGRVKPSYRLQAEDNLRLPPLAVPSQVSADLKGVNCPELADLILFEDPHCLVINKPFGLVVHGGSHHRVGLVENLREAREDLHSLQLGHRLDKYTSGCLVLAKSYNFLKKFHNLLKTAKVQKRYQTLVHGQWPETLLQVSAPLEKNKSCGAERMTQVQEGGKDALTQFKVLQRFSQLTLLEASPITGRTHQIRVHAAQSGYPICGDPKYGDRILDKRVCPQLKRMFLHAGEISFQDPETGHHYRISAPLPQELKVLLQAMA